MSARTRSYTDLRGMDRETARQTLTVPEYERWERVNDLFDGAEQTRETWREQDERVAGLAVAADMEQLGTRVDLYGNDLLVHADSEDDDLQAAAARVEDEFGGMDTDEVDALSDDDRERLADVLFAFYDALIVEWNGEPFGDLPDETRHATLESARERWGLDAMFIGFVDLCVAINEEREETLDVIEKFRDPARRGRR